ncbi:MAG: hydantoinase B/oxoprolinase family protein [Gemmatimonadales bacterium]|nr:hydantoinase B/oxoprolinase family protein [Gemmatimonadales bacterium]
MLSPVEREVMAQLFAAIPEEMGAVLVRSARSPNVRERRDSSAALFTASGELIAQAAHIPVHLGAMPDAVAAVMAKGPRAGDGWVLNDPYTGGTHLPDITVIEAVGRTGSSAPPIAFAVVRAHHADVGGTRPGSMPPGARTLREEGVIIPPTRIAADGETIDDVVESLVTRMREPEVRRADLAAQLAAAARGGERWRELLARYGAEWLGRAVQDLLLYAERRTRAALATLRDGVYDAEDFLEGDGITDDLLSIRVRVTIKEGALAIDFAGTAPACAGNVNCPISVARSAALFVARCLIPDDVPTNGGVARCITVTAPDGCLVNARAPHAVAAGNVETSQRIADVLFLALAQAGAPVVAPGQGTMNNVILGTDSWTYYETLGGGQGGGAKGPGPSGVHVGMSNTMNTPVEVMEMELPVRVERYEIRRGSGGERGERGEKGERGGRGGDGVIRELRVLEPCSLSLITERRVLGPRGLAGGGNGKPGRNLVNGREVGSKVALEVVAGDVVRIETPGGGGFGAPG